MQWISGIGGWVGATTSEGIDFQNPLNHLTSRNLAVAATFEPHPDSTPEPYQE